MSFLTRILEHASLRAQSFISIGRALRLAGIVGIAAAGSVALPSRAQTDDAAATEMRSLNVNNKAWSGDFDGMLERRLVRVAVPYGRTLFYHDRGRELGLTANAVRKFEEYSTRSTRRVSRSGPSRSRSSR
jgi:hypothetical protein